jgi:hypothetical protein
MKTEIKSDGKQTTITLIPESRFEENIVESMNLYDATTTTVRSDEKTLEIIIHNHKIDESRY